MKVVNALEFNLQYDGHIVHLKVIEGQFKGDSYRTLSTSNQAYTDHNGDTLVAVKGLARCLKLEHCEVTKAVKLSQSWS